jgi:hypothetical protein
MVSRPREKPILFVGKVGGNSISFLEIQRFPPAAFPGPLYPGPIPPHDATVDP